MFTLSYTFYSFVLLVFYLSAHTVYKPFTSSCTQCTMLTFAVIVCVTLPAVAAVDEMSSSYLVPLDMVHKGLVALLCVSAAVWALLSLCGVWGLKRTLVGEFNTEQRLLCQYVTIAVLASVIAGYIWLCQWYNAVNWMITDYNAAVAEWFAVLVAIFVPYCYAVSFPGFEVEVAFRNRSEKREN